MRDAIHQLIHQLSLALALPLAVSAVWLIRGEPQTSAAPERAAAYRADLGELPLPGRLRLRLPRDSRTPPPRAPAVEEPAAERRRAALPNPPAPLPVELARAASAARPVSAGTAAPRSLAPVEPAAGAPPAAPEAPVALLTPVRVLSRSRSNPATGDPVPAALAKPSETPTATDAEKPAPTAVAASKVGAAGSLPISEASSAPVGFADSKPFARPSAEPVAPSQSAHAAFVGPLVQAKLSPGHADPSPGWGPKTVPKAPRADSPPRATPVFEREPLRPDSDRDSAVPIGLRPLTRVAELPEVSAAADFALPSPASSHAFAGAPDERGPAHEIGPEAFETPAPHTRFSPILLMIPEPGSALLLGAGIAAFAATRRSRA